VTTRSALDFNLATSNEIVRALGLRLRAQRLARSITQEELASRAGVAVGSVKKLESSGNTTLRTFISIVQALSLVDEFATILALKPQASIAEMERAEGAARQRARRRTAA
jgi:transcriptional regulator with XRE-family HTH domain